MDPKKIVAWIAVPGVALAAVIGIATQWGGVEDRWELLAQESGTAAAEIVVNQHAEVAEARLAQLVDAGRRSEDRELLATCETRAERRGEEPLDYEQACAEESNLRWLWWEYDDCLIEGRECVEPMRDRP